MLDSIPVFKTLLTLFVLMGLPVCVLAIDLNGSWSYRESGGDNSETFRELRQNYSFGVGPALNYRPSHALSANTSVGYTQTNGVDAQGSRTGRTITPTVGLGLKNDLFSTRISASSGNTQVNGGDWSTSTSWNTTFESGWAEPYVPQFNFSYGETGESTQSEVVGSLETQRKDFGAGVNWDLNLADMTYRYRHSRPGDQSTTQSHFVKLNTGGRSWDNRLSFSLSQQAQFDSIDISGGTLGEFVNVPVGGVVNLGSISALTSVEAGCNFGVECLGSAVPFSYTLPDRRVLIAVTPVENRNISVVEISFKTGDSVAEIDRGDGSEWVLYEDSSGSWQPVAGQLPIIAIAVPGVDGRNVWRQRITIPATDQKFMLVSDRDSDGKIIGVDTFEVFPLRPEGSGRTSQRYLTNAGIQMRFSESVSTSLGFTYERNESESDAGAEPVRDSDKISTSGNLSWTPFTFLTASVGANEYRELKLGDEQQLNRNYSLTFSTAPLSTMKVSFGVLLSERYGVMLENEKVDIDQKSLETMSYTVSGKAQLYPDLTAGFNLSFNDGKRWLKDEGADTGRFVDNASQGYRLDLNAKLFENLTADLATRYSQSESDGSLTESGSAEFGLRFRPSELLLVRGSYTKDFINDDAPDSISLRVQARLVDTDKSHLAAQASYTLADEAVEQISLNGSWLLTKDMSLVGRGGYSFGESNNYNLTLDLRIRI